MSWQAWDSPAILKKPGCKIKQYMDAIVPAKCKILGPDTFFVGKIPPSASKAFRHQLQPPRWGKRKEDPWESVGCSSRSLLYFYPLFLFLCIYLHHTRVLRRLSAVGWVFRYTRCCVRPRPSHSLQPWVLINVRGRGASGGHTHTITRQLRDSIPPIYPDPRTLRTTGRNERRSAGKRGFDK